jgi:hypothetical protein
MSVAEIDVVLDRLDAVIWHRRCPASDSQLCPPKGRLSRIKSFGFGEQVGSGSEFPWDVGVFADDQHRGCRQSGALLLVPYGVQYEPELRRRGFRRVSGQAQRSGHLPRRSRRLLRRASTEAGESPMRSRQSFARSWTEPAERVRPWIGDELKGRRRAVAACGSPSGQREALVSPAFTTV